MRSVSFIAEAATTLPRHQVKRSTHGLAGLGAMLGASLLVIVILACVLRATESVITSHLIIPEAHAATISSDTYAAKLLLRTAPAVNLAPGETSIYRVGFKNLGTKIWKNSGPEFVSLYTTSPKYRTSVFVDSSWRASSQPSVLKDPSVPPGMVGFFEFVLHAPHTVGTYQENFAIAVEDTTWISGGSFSIAITVATPRALLPSPTLAPTPGTVQLPALPVDGYGAVLLLRSQKQEVFLEPGQTMEVTLGFKNTGTRVWHEQVLRPQTVALADFSPSFRHLSWAGPDAVVRSTDAVNPGAIGFLKFTLQAPQQKGAYRSVFQLVTDGVTVPGGEVEIPVTVTADGQSSAAPITLPAAQMVPEPLIRVGLFKSTGPVMISASGDYDILQNGAVAQTVVAGQPSKIIFDFDYHTYSVTSPNGTQVYRSPVRLVPHTTDTIFTILSYEHATGWNAALNDNQFRGTLEVLYVPETGNLWVVDELPMEQYLRGLGETSNDSPIEYQKAIVTAARTYAYYHYLRNSKHGGYFHVDASADQVYRGYKNEVRTPNLTQAVDSTRGVVATYQGQLALTPYYSRSDGRTRAWEEVWGGAPKPWLPSVPTPYDQGQTLWGHGVGMSARDALYRARDGASWDTILKYYYRGIDLTKQWQ